MNVKQQPLGEYEYTNGKYNARTLIQLTVTRYKMTDGIVSLIILRKLINISRLTGTFDSPWQLLTTLLPLILFSSPTFPLEALLLNS